VEKDFPTVITTEIGTMVMPEFNKVIHMRETRFEDMIQTEKDIVLAHQLQDNENKKLLEKKGICLGDVEEEAEKVKQVEHVEKTGEEELDEELVHYEECQDKFQENEEGEDDLMESQETFSTKVKKMTSGTPSREEMIQVKLQKDRGK
jgi:hypothetical protein